MENSRHFPLKTLKMCIEYRYQKELYVGASKSLTYHFLYGYLRLLIEVAKSAIYVFLFFKFSMKNQKNSRTSIALYNTNNQRKALLNLKNAKDLDFSVRHISSVSIVFSLMRMLAWIIKLIIYPFSFIFAKNKAGIFHGSQVWSLYLYNKILINELTKSVSDLYISNDHSGDIYIVSILARLTNVKVHYVQHGAVKLEFPENYFDVIYVQNEYYADIYKQISLSPEVDIIVYDLITAKNDNVESVDVLVAFSHQFYLFKSIQLIKKLKSLDKKTALRFHPSDRFSLYKFRMLKLFYPSISYSSVDELTYWEDFERSLWHVCASSSLLLDIYRYDGGKTLIWYKPIGLSWDYYDLEDKLKVVNDINGLEFI